MVSAIKPESVAVGAVPDELPGGWAIGNLEECSTLITKGSTPTSYGFEYKKSGINFIRVENLENGSVNRSSLSVYIDKTTDEALKRSRLQAGDLLFSIAGTIGETAMVTAGDLPANTNQALSIIRGTQRIFDTSFLKFALASSVTQRQANKGARGGSMNNISLADVKSLQLPIAPKSEQTRIVAKIDELLKHVNASRERLAKVPKILRAFRQSVLAAACYGRLTEDWRDAGGSPWGTATVKEVIVGKPRNGLSIKAVDYETPVRSLTLTATTSGRFDGRHFKYLDIEIPSGSHLWLQKGDILLQRGNTDEYVGIAAAYDGDDNAYIYPDLMIKIRPGSKVTSEFLWIALSEPQARQYFRENASGSQGSMPKINQGVVEEAVIPLPPRREQQEIARRVEILFKLADKIEKRVEAATKRADRLTQAVLAKAFRGELVPTEAALARQESREYESAAALLERIKRQRTFVDASTNGRRKPSVGRRGLA